MCSEFATEEQALVAFTRAVARDRVTDALHEAMAEQFDDDTIVRAAPTAAGNVTLNTVISALDVELVDGDEFAGWDPR